MENQMDQPPYPPGVILLMLLLLLLLSMMAGQVLLLVLEQVQGLSLRNLINSDASEFTSRERNFFRWQAVINQLFSFVVPAIVLSLVLMRSGWYRFLGLHHQPELTWIGLSIAWLILALPLVQVVYWLNQQLPLPPEMLELEAGASALIKGFLTMETWPELLLSLLAMAVLPAVGEELVFRGIVQRSLERAFANPVLAVWVGAVLFSAFHLQFQGFLPRVLLGALLGYLFLWSRSLWVPIVAHGVYNGMQVLAAYSLDLDVFAEEGQQMAPRDWVLSVLSIIFVVWLGSLMQRKYARTPNFDDQST